MQKYLDNILRGRHLNVSAFFKACEKKGISRVTVRDIFEIKSCNCGARNQYFLTVKDPEQYQQYFSRFHERDDDKKVEASLHGSSKGAKSACGALVYRSNYQDAMGDSLLFQDNKCLQWPSITESLLIVENANTFVKLSPDVVPNIDLEAMPVIWGRGTDITGAQYLDLLSRYKRIVCFFDYDLGGLKIYSSLYQNLGSRLSLYVHPQLESCLKDFGMPLSQSQYVAIQNISVDDTSKQVADALLTHKKWLEQEVLQAQIIKG